MSAPTLAAAAVAPTDLYARGLGGTGRLLARHEDGTSRPVPLRCWLDRAGPEDARVLDRARGPVLDLGCGPGRHVAMLARRGVTSLGIDVSPVAVGLARSRGGAACVGDVFGPVPAAGRWRTALLLDGNIGIGGRPARLLRRAAALLAPGGTVLVELDPPGALTGSGKIRLEDGETTSAWFPWAHVAADDVDGVARAAGLHVRDAYTEGDRWFADLARA